MIEGIQFFRSAPGDALLKIGEIAWIGQVTPEDILKVMEDIGLQVTFIDTENEEE